MAESWKNTIGRSHMDLCRLLVSWESKVTAVSPSLLKGYFFSRKLIDELIEGLGMFNLQPGSGCL